MVKIVVSNFIEKKNARMQQLKDQMHEVKEAKKAGIEKFDTLEQLLKIKDDQYSATNAQHGQHTYNWMQPPSLYNMRLLSL